MASENIARAAAALAASQQEVAELRAALEAAAAVHKRDARLLRAAQDPLQDKPTSQYAAGAARASYESSNLCGAKQMEAPPVYGFAGAPPDFHSSGRPHSPASADETSTVEGGKAATAGGDRSFVWKERYLAIFTRMLQLEFKATAWKTEHGRMARALQAEVGPEVPMDAVLAASGGDVKGGQAPWRGRAAQIGLLTAQLAAAKGQRPGESDSPQGPGSPHSPRKPGSAQLATSSIASARLARRPATVMSAADGRRDEVARLKAELEAANAALAEARSRAQAASVRRSILEGEVKAMRAHLQALLRKGGNDDRLIATLQAALRGDSKAIGLVTTVTAADAAALDAATKAAQEPVASQPLPLEGPRTAIPLAGGGPDVLICSDHPLQAPATAVGADGGGRLSSPCTSFGGSAHSGAELEAAAAAAAADTAPEAPAQPLQTPTAAVDISDAASSRQVTSGTASARHTGEASAALKQATVGNALDEQPTALSSEMDSTDDGRCQDSSVSTTAQPLPHAPASAEAGESIHIVESRQPSESDESAAHGDQAHPVCEPVAADTRESAERQPSADTPAADAPAHPLGEGQVNITPESRENLPVQQAMAAAAQSDPTVPILKPPEHGTNCTSTGYNGTCAYDDIALRATAEDATNHIADEPVEGDGLAADEAQIGVPAEMLDIVPADLAGSGPGMTEAGIDAGTAGGLASQSYPATAASHQSDKDFGEELPVELPEAPLQSSVDVQLADNATLAVGNGSSEKNETATADNAGTDQGAAMEPQSTELTWAESEVIDLGREQPAQGFDHEQPHATGELEVGTAPRTEQVDAPAAIHADNHCTEAQSSEDAIRAADTAETSGPAEGIASQQSEPLHCGAMPEMYQGNGNFTVMADAAAEGGGRELKNSPRLPPVWAGVLQEIAADAAAGLDMPTGLEPPLTPGIMTVADQPVAEPL